MLNPDYIKKAFQVHLRFQTPDQLRKELVNGGENLPISIKPALQNPEVNSFSNKLNHQTTWSSLLELIHEDCAARYLSKIHKILEKKGEPAYFISFKQLAERISSNYGWYFCFTRLIPEGNSLFLLYVSLSADEVWMRETERFVKQETYRLEYMDKFNALTEREKEIIQWVASGSTNPETARGLGISRRTVESHRKNINRKLGMNNLAELVRFALAFELV